MNTTTIVSVLFVLIAAHWGAMVRRPGDTINHAHRQLWVALVGLTAPWALLGGVVAIAERSPMVAVLLLLAALLCVLCVVYAALWLNRPERIARLTNEKQLRSRTFSPGRAPIHAP